MVIGIRNGSPAGAVDIAAGIRNSEFASHDISRPHPAAISPTSSPDITAIVPAVEFDGRASGKAA
ncbi:hypothetical protein [Mycolicibacterium bacteremicum]|uniref:hypothetical protein n=1 Tax=Mycolicibacterium bacteremicum TaxID=564198 RepID=UPI001055A9A2|nr:hypothetical protein [Mycolicibacterium bacteremicum]MCV7433556.1 hypothetical protein [Mycolicibacterium bacteremicum]